MLSNHTLCILNSICSIFTSYNTLLYRMDYSYKIHFFINLKTVIVHERYLVYSLSFNKFCVLHLINLLSEIIQFILCSLLTKICLSKQDISKTLEI